MRKIDIEELTEKGAKATEIIKELEKTKEEAQKAKEEAVDEVQKAIKEVRGALGKEGVLISVKEFEEQAQEHSILAEEWLSKTYKAIGIFVILAIILFVIPWFNISDNASYAEIARISIFKIVLLSIGSLLIYQSIRNYRINRHLYVLNRHRQLSLSIYPLMVQSTSDPQQANAITSQAAKAIFDPSTTGHLDGKDNPNPANLTEIVNRVSDKI